MDEKNDAMILEVFYILSYEFFTHTKIMGIISFCAKWNESQLHIVCASLELQYEQQEALLGYTILRLAVTCELNLNNT